MRPLTLAVTAFAACAMLAYAYADARGGRGGGRGGGSHSGARSGGWHSHSHGHSRGFSGGFHRPGRFRSGGFFVAAPLFGYGYGYAPYPYYGAYAAPAAPVYYVERTDGYWYYCPDAGRYYPDVETCDTAWVPVQAYNATTAP